MTRRPSGLQYAGLIAATTCTTAVSMTLLAIRNKKYHSNFSIYVADNRASIQVLVQIIAHTLAVLQLWVVKVLFNYATRISLLARKVSLDQYGFWTAASQLTIACTVSTKYIIILALAVILSIIPGAIWAGALTPVIVNDVGMSGSFDVPLFTASTGNNWNSEFQTQDNGQVFNLVDTCKTISDARGFLPSCPVPGYSGQLLLSASTATPNNASDIRKHSKLSNPEWSYLGRSYGVGSSIGLRPAVPSKIKAVPLSYSYRESGYMSNVKCYRNSSSQLEFWYDPSSPSDYPVYQLTGALSNVPQNLSDDYPASTWWPNYERLLGWKARAYGGINLISVASGLQNYTLFHHVECTVDFEPTVFEVLVNVSSSTVLVLPTENQADDVDPSGDLIFNVMASINLLSRMENSNYVSVRGEALQNNLINAKLRAGRDGDDIVLSSVQDSTAAMIDDILVDYGVSQIAHTSDVSTIPAQLLVQGMSAGIPFYVYITFGINCALILLLSVETVRTRLWSDLPVLDYSNIKCAIFAASHGGHQIADEICTRTIGLWNGTPDDEVFSKVSVGLSQRYGLPQLVSTNQDLQLFLSSSKQQITSQSALLSPGYVSKSLTDTSLATQPRESHLVN